MSFIYLHFPSYLHVYFKNRLKLQGLHKQKYQIWIFNNTHLKIYNIFYSKIKFSSLNINSFYHCESDIQFFLNGESAEFKAPLRNLYLIKMQKIPSFFSIEKSLFLLTSPLLLKNKKCASHIRRETANKIYSLNSLTKTLLYNSYLISQRNLEGTVVNRAWRDTYTGSRSPQYNILISVPGQPFQSQFVLYRTDIGLINQTINWTSRCNLRLTRSDFMLHIGSDLLLLKGQRCVLIVLFKEHYCTQISRATNRYFNRYIWKNKYQDSGVFGQNSRL